MRSIRLYKEKASFTLGPRFTDIDIVDNKARKITQVSLDKVKVDPKFDGMTKWRKSPVIFGMGSN